VGAAVIAIIARAAAKLARSVIGSDRLLWAVFLALCISTAVTEREIVWLFILAGLVAMVVRARPRPSAASARVGLIALLVPAVTGGKFAELLIFFGKASLFVFGSGLAIVPFLHGGVVVDHHWLTERQFVDAVAVAMLTPGPVVITVAFIGYLVDGLPGAIAAGLGIFIPVYLMVVLAAPHFSRLARNPQLNAFVKGVTAAAAGAIAGAVIVLARRSIYDIPTALMGLAVFLILTKWKIPEPLLIVGAGLAGLLLQR
jgi:chromate transporter